VAGEGPPGYLGTLRQAEQIVRLLAVGARLDVLVAVLTRGDNDINLRITLLDIEGPAPAFDAGYSLLLGYLPRRPVPVAPADVGNALVRVVAVAFVDAKNLIPLSHIVNLRSPYVGPCGQRLLKVFDTGPTFRLQT